MVDRVTPAPAGLAAEGPGSDRGADRAEFEAAHADLVSAEVKLLAGEVTVEQYAPIWLRANDAQRRLADAGAWPLV